MTRAVRDVLQQVDGAGGVRHVGAREPDEAREVLDGTALEMRRLGRAWIEGAALVAAEARRRIGMTSGACPTADGGVAE